jgi:Arc/MetJ-type ribon-helix-helix transcriptional regulator
MVMDTLQIRMNKELIKRIDSLVKTGVYSNRSDVIRDSVRRFIWEREVGTLKNNNMSSANEIRGIRKKLSKKPIVLEEINNFGKL